MFYNFKFELGFNIQRRFELFLFFFNRIQFSFSFLKQKNNKILILFTQEDFNYNNLNK